MCACTRYAVQGEYGFRRKEEIGKSIVYFPRLKIGVTDRTNKNPTWHKAPE